MRNFADFLGENGKNKKVGGGEVFPALVGCS